MMYLCSVSYSLAEMVYRSAFWRMGSAAAVAEMRLFFALGGSEDEDDIVDMCMVCANGEWRGVLLHFLVVRWKGEREVLALAIWTMFMHVEITSAW